MHVTYTYILCLYHMICCQLVKLQVEIVSYNVGIISKTCDWIDMLLVVDWIDMLLVVDWIAMRYACINISSPNTIGNTCSLAQCYWCQPMIPVESKENIVKM